MATIEQIQDFTRFAEQLPQAERDGLSIDEIYERWRQVAFRDEDLNALRDSLDDYDRGERGVPADEALADFRAERVGKTHQ